MKGRDDYVKLLWTYNHVHFNIVIPVNKKSISGYDSFCRACIRQMDVSTSIWFLFKKRKVIDYDRNKFKQYKEIFWI